MPLLLANERPQFVHFDPADPKTNHDPVVQLGTAAPDPRPKAHDGVPMDAGQSLDGPNAHAFGQTTDDLDLLISGKKAHGDTASDNLIPDTISLPRPLSIRNYRL